MLLIRTTLLHEPDSNSVTLSSSMALESDHSKQSHTQLREPCIEKQQLFTPVVGLDSNMFLDCEHHTQGEQVNVTQND